MDGRLEIERKIDESINRKLKNLPSYVSDWNKNMKASRKTAATRRDFISKVRLFLQTINPDAKAVSVKDITEEVVTDYMLSIQTKVKYGNVEYTSDSYQRTIWSCLNNFFSFLYDRGMIEKNYIKMIEPPKNNDLERINEHRVLLTMDDFKEILKSVDDEPDCVLRKRDKAILLVFMNTGMRKSALTTVTINDVDLRNGTLTVVDKGSKRHQYILNNEVKSAINDWLGVRHRYTNGKRSGYLFISQRGNMLSCNALTYAVEKYTENALGEPLSPHKLRAGYCSILYDATHDIEFVRRAVGHSNTSVTQRYIVTSGKEREEAANILSGLTT